jgi:hypothetical protein
LNLHNSKPSNFPPLASSDSPDCFQPHYSVSRSKFCTAIWAVVWPHWSSQLGVVCFRSTANCTEIKPFLDVSWTIYVDISPRLYTHTLVWTDNERREGESVGVGWGGRWDKKNTVRIHYGNPDTYTCIQKMWYCDRFFDSIAVNPDVNVKYMQAMRIGLLFFVLFCVQFLRVSNSSFFLHILVPCCSFVPDENVWFLYIICSLDVSHNPFSSCSSSPSSHRHPNPAICGRSDYPACSALGWVHFLYVGANQEVW